MKFDFSNQIRLILKIAFILAIFSGGTAIYGLQTEEKIELLEQQVEKIREENLSLNDWSLTFSGNYADTTSYFDKARLTYYKSGKIIDQNKLCHSLINVGPVSVMSYFIQEYDNKIPDEMSNRYGFTHIKVFHEYFKNNYHAGRLRKKFKSEDLSYSEYRSAVREGCKKHDVLKFMDDLEKLNRHQKEFLRMTIEMKNKNFALEKELYSKIENASNKSASMFLYAFYLQLILSFCIVFFDVYTTRGKENE